MEHGGKLTAGNKAARRPPFWPIYQRLDSNPPPAFRSMIKFRLQPLSNISPGTPRPSNLTPHVVPPESHHRHGSARRDRKFPRMHGRGGTRGESESEIEVGLSEGTTRRDHSRLIDFSGANAFLLEVEKRWSRFCVANTVYWVYLSLYLKMYNIIWCFIFIYSVFRPTLGADRTPKNNEKKSDKYMSYLSHKLWNILYIVIKIYNIMYLIFKDSVLVLTLCWLV